MQSVLHEAPQFVLRWQKLTEAANIDIGARLPGRGSDEAFWRGQMHFSILAFSILAF
jgi:hypothetical protein